MKFTVRYSGRTKRNLQKLTASPRAVNLAVYLALEDWGDNLIRNTENEILNVPKYGRWYPSGNLTKLPRDNHRASAPKQSPAYYKGKYFKGLGVRISSHEIEFGNKVKYAPYLEKGTSKMEARPALKNSIDRTQRNFRNYYFDNLEMLLGFSK